MLNVYTAQYRYNGEDRKDITVKLAKLPWKLFAPTWPMVMDYKRTGDEQKYIEQYNVIIKKASCTLGDDLYKLIHSDRTITLVCFCAAGKFCHRVLLAQHFAQLGANYIGERK